MPQTEGAGLVNGWKMYFRPARLLATLAAITGLGLTAWLALRGADTKQPPSAKEALAIAAFAAIAQLVAAFAWSRIGRSDPTHSIASVRRLATVKNQTERLLLEVEAAYETGNAKDIKTQMGRVSASLEFINESIGNSIADWVEFNQELTDKMRSEQEENEDG